jgi:biotin synthase
MTNKEVYLCAICNISSGSCSEDCSFCTQSAKYNADIDLYKHKSLDLILKEAKSAHESGAIGFCLVTSGKGMDDKKLRFVCQSSEHIKKALPDLNLIACNGLASKDDMRILKDHGISSYNHNLESSKSYYEKICSTHRWEDRYQTCLNAKEVGLDLCCGGIFGMGEDEDDRYSLVESIKSLEPISVAMNFFHPNSALPLQKSLNLDESLFWIQYMRKNLDKAMIMVAGGREITFGDRVGEIFKMGANSMVIGNYLTTSGNSAKSDLRMLKDLGLKVAKNCGK